MLQVPEAVVKKDSTSYNTGRVWINRGRQEVVDAYTKQSQKDLTSFMKCRAEEMAAGGVLFLCLMGRPDTCPPSQQVSMGGEFCGQDFEDAWDDLVMEVCTLLCHLFLGDFSYCDIPIRI